VPEPRYGHWTPVLGAELDGGCRRPVVGGHWTLVVKWSVLVSESDGERRNLVVGAGAVKHNNLRCHCRNMAGIADVAWS